jgi:hypothetical protein
MPTLRILARPVPNLGLSAAFAGVVASFLTMIDVFADAQDQARAAHQRYPFAEW